MKTILAALIATLILCGCDVKSEHDFQTQIKEKDKEIQLLKVVGNDPIKYLQLKEQNDKDEDKARLLPRITEFKSVGRNKVYYFALPEGDEFGKAMALFFELQEHADEELVDTVGDLKGGENIGEVGGRYQVLTRNRGYWVFTRKIK